MNFLKFFRLNFCTPMIWAMLVSLHFLFVGETPLESLVPKRISVATVLFELLLQ